MIVFKFHYSLFKNYVKLFETYVRTLMHIRLLDRYIASLIEIMNDLIVKLKIVLVFTQTIGIKC